MFPVSKIAASAVILAVNICKLREKFIQKFGQRKKMQDKMEQKSDSNNNVDIEEISDHFFKEVDSQEKGSVNHLYFLNTDIWDKKQVYKLTEYTIEDLKESLTALSKFVSDNLVPNKLKYFNLAAIDDLSNSRDVQNLKKILEF